jgi:hypothetical protein
MSDARGPVESPRGIAFEVAQQLALTDLRRRLHDEVHVIEHDRNGDERPAAVGSGFLELIEELLGLRQIEGDGRSLELLARGPL